MGLYQNQSLAFYYRLGLLIFSMMSLVVCYISFQNLSIKRNLLLMKKPLVKHQLPSLDYWMRSAQKWHLRVIRFRPKAQAQIQLGVQGHYQDLLSYLTAQTYKHPHWQWSRIMIEKKDDVLWMYWDLNL